MGRPPKSTLRDDKSYPISSLSKDPIVRDFMNEYWSQTENSTPLLPISRDKTKVEYIEADPLVNEEEKEAYRNKESERLKFQFEQDEITKLRSQNKELQQIKDAHLREIEEYRIRQNMYESTIRHFLDKEKNATAIYTRERNMSANEDPSSSYVSPVVERKKPEEMIHGLPKNVYLGIREQLLRKK